MRPNTPGPLPLAGVCDSNGAILAAAIKEAGREAIPLGIGDDEEGTLGRLIEEGLACADIVPAVGRHIEGLRRRLLPGSRALRRSRVVVQGVALKPGKPLCLAVTAGKLMIVLPGFPTSAIFMFLNL